MKFPGLHRKVMFVNLHPMKGKGQIGKKSFASSCMKYLDLDKKVVFAYMSPYGVGSQVAKITLFCLELQKMFRSTQKSNFFQFFL